ncbi:MAG TPA: cystathionine gamma-synthase [Steroidobacteraceae bacterium]|nr:cystathionine gamma-synthase [Steroidobacteraceae bacterium]
MSNRTDPITRAVRAGLESDETGAVVPPIHLSATFAFRGFDDRRTYDYTRSGNPTRDLLGRALAELEGGAGSVVTATGMAAITLVGYLLPAGARIVAPHDCYGGTYRLFEAWQRRGELTTEFVNFADEAAVRAALAAPTALLWIETPSNPLLRITDIERFAALGHASGALVVVDNTFLSPLWQRPFEFGADLVVHSTTKYLNGHSDVVGGAVIARTQEQCAQLIWWANCLGLTGAPFDSYLTLRGLRTLHARLVQHERNALALAQWLREQPGVARVYYPGLASHPGHDIARRQQRGFGAVVSTELAGGRDAVRALTCGLACFSLAESLGGVESLIAHPATMTHAAMDPEARRRAGLADGLIRLSVGIEALDDLRSDLAAGLERARRATSAAVPRRPAVAGA